MDKQQLIDSLYETINNIRSMPEGEFREKMKTIDREYQKVHEALSPDSILSLQPVFGKPVRRNKHTRFLIARRKLKKLYSKTKNVYGVGAYYDYRKKRIAKESVNSSAERTACNRRFRRRWKNGRYEDVANGSSYKKYEDYWWSVL